LALGDRDIFTALEPYYPQTVKYFRRIPNGEFDLQRAYWWEKRWRQAAKSGFKQQSAPVEPPIVPRSPAAKPDSTWDIIVIGGALGTLYATTMARLGYEVALLERLPFGRMNREWNISRQELQTLIDLGLLTPQETESIIAQEYRDGFNLFFQGNNPPQAKAPVLHTPTVLNIALDSDRLLQICGEKLVEAGGHIFDRTEFECAYLEDRAVTIQARHLDTDEVIHLQARLVIDAMGTASPIAQHINGDRAFDSVCPTVGAVMKRGFPEGVWDSQYGDVLFSHGDISRGRQLIWELFPGRDDELTIYLFHYHEIHPDNPGSLLEMYEDFFTILPEYRRCEMDSLEWGKATFGYIPGRFGGANDKRQASCDRILSIGDAASLQSPLVFTGFGSLVRNLPRLSAMLQGALKHDLLTGADLNRVNAFQNNIAVTWLFSRGMMVPTGEALPPERINAILNTFFGVLADQPPEIADDFIKDRAGWLSFNRMALQAAWRNPKMLVWIWQLVGAEGFLAWFPTYLSYTGAAIQSFLFGWWVPPLVYRNETAIASRWPRLWHRLQAWSFRLTYGMGKPPSPERIPALKALVTAERANASVQSTESPQPQPSSVK
ncbi:MAG: flavin-dependent dehydrogenase, partial [Cyanobacteria bacterium P01_E01_bin.48]